MRDSSCDRLYRLLPGHVRARDHEQGRPLQALLRILTQELEVVEADLDAGFENWFIETCEDWVIPYLGDLVGARHLRPFGEDGGGLRAFVANTLSYRQAKGTAAVLEQIARDVTGWPARAVEVFRRLHQSQHLNHVRPEVLATASLRDADAAGLAGGPFENAFHSVGIRPVTTGEGRYNIPNVALFLWRLDAVVLPFVYDGLTGYLGGVQPAASTHAPGLNHLDPVGRDLPLFNRQRTEPTLAHLAGEADLPGPLRRRPLHDDLEALRAGVPGAGVYFVDPPAVRVRLDGVPVPPEDLFCCNLEDRDDGQGGITWRRPNAPGEVALDPELGRLALHPDDAGKPVEVSVASGAAHDLGGGPSDRRDSVAAWFGPFAAAAETGSLWQLGVSRRPEQVTDIADQGGPVVGSLAAAVERWNVAAAPGARGVIAIMDSATYSEDLSTAARRIRIPAGARLAIVAAGWPVVEIGGGARRRTPGELAPQDRRPYLASDLVTVGEAQPDEDPGALILDGLLIGGRVAVAAGDLGRLELRHTTAGVSAQGLGPGIDVAAAQGADNSRLAVVLDHTVCGPASLGTAAGTVRVTDSILGEDLSANPDPASVPLVLEAPRADIALARSTFYGRVVGRTLSADDSILVGPPLISRRQEGCVRFCYLPGGGRAPRRFRCVPDLQLAEARERLGRALTASEERALRTALRPVFTASALGHPAFGQLALTCPPEIAAGAEAGAEMGAMNRLGNPARVANLRDALDEYLPFGLEAGPFFVT